MDGNPFEKSNWWTLLPAAEIQALRRIGFGRKTGLGLHPALLVVDAQNTFVGEDKPLLESMKRYPVSSGASAPRALRIIGRLISSFRQTGLPIIYTKSRSFAKAAPKAKAGDLDIVEKISPHRGDFVIEKFAPSPFYGTNILQILNRCGVDSVVVTGGTTSGWVRATVVDAFSAGYKVVVVPEATFDRIQLSRDIGLFGLWL